MRSNHTESNYLIQHSAGSGKTNTIAWLAHSLVSLHDEENNNIVDTVLIVTDRIVVDRQLQDAVKQIGHKNGVVKVMGDRETSSDLADAIAGIQKSLRRQSISLHRLISQIGCLWAILLTRSLLF